MISILFIILKIIGITLLAIVGILLFLLLLVLLVPVRYRFNGGYEDAFCCDGKVTWLLHFVSVRIHVDKKVNTDVRILGIPLSVFRKKKQKNTGKSEKRNQESPLANENISEDVIVESGEKQAEHRDKVAGEAQDIDKLEDAVFMKTGENVSGENTASAKNHGTQTVEGSNAIGEEGTSKQTGKKSLLQKITAKIGEIVQKIKDIINKIKNLIRKIKDFVRNAEDKKVIVKRWLKILQSDTAKAAFALCKNKLSILLKHILPKKMLVNIHYGFEDPADTGYTLAVYGMLPGWIGKRFVLHPDFNKELFQCDFRLKGSIRMGTLLYHVLCVIRDKNCKRLYHIVKKEIKHERK